MKRLLTLIFWAQRRHIGDLMRQRDEWRKIAEHERGRSEALIDKLLALQLGLPPVQAVQRQEPAVPPSAEDEVWRLLRETDALNVGRVPDGV